MAKLLPGNSKFKKSCQWGIVFKLIPVARLLLLLLILCVYFLNPLHAQVTSKADGDWNTSGTWDIGSVPTALDSVIINHIVTIPTGTTAEVDKLNINPLGHLIVEGSLLINGDLEMSDEKNNYSYLDAYSESVIIVKGNVFLSNKTNIGLNSYFIVLGDFSFSNGGGAADFDINDASIYVFGNFDKGGSSLVICNDYDNNTDDYNIETCHVGTDSAFFNNIEEDLIPDEIIDLVVTCNTTATISGDAIICDGESTNLSVALTGTQPWIITYIDGTTSVTVNDITNSPHTITVTPNVSKTYTLTAVSDANCTGTTAGIATVSVNGDVLYTPGNDTTICAGETATLKIKLDDKAILLNGTNGGIDIANSPEINTSTVQKRTVAFWFNANDVNTRQVLYEEGAGVNGFSVFLESGFINVHAWESNNSWGEVRTYVSIGNWYHIAFVFDSSTPDSEYFKGYLNGVYFGGNSNAAAANGMNAHSGDINIGMSDGIRFPYNNTYPGNYYNGYIDEFKLWNRPLTGEELSVERWNVNDGTQSGANLIVYYSFNNDVLPTVTDLTGGNNGIVAGGVSYETATPFTPVISWLPGGMTGFTEIISPVTTTVYNYTLTHPFNNCETTGSVIVTVNTSVGGTASSDQTICSGSLPSDITLSGYTGDIQWQFSTDNINFSNISGASTETLTSSLMGTISETTYFRAEVTNGNCDPDYSNVVTVTVAPSVKPSVSIAAEPGLAICSDTEVTFTATATYRGFNPVYQWQVNNIEVGANSTILNYVPDDGDVVSCILTFDAACAGGSEIIPITTFSWDDDTKDVTDSDSGLDAIGIGGGEYIAGGVGGTLALRPVTVPKTDINLNFGDQAELNTDGVDYSISFRRAESVGQLFRRGYSLIISGGSTFNVSYRLDDGVGSFTTVTSSNFSINQDGSFHDYRFVYDPFDGIGRLYIDNSEVWASSPTPGQSMYWTGAGSLIVGVGIDASGDPIPTFDNLSIKGIRLNTAVDEKTVIVHPLPATGEIIPD